MKSTKRVFYEVLHINNSFHVEWYNWSYFKSMLKMNPQWRIALGVSAYSVSIISIWRKEGHIK